jgi:hypothetical protein
MMMQSRSIPVTLTALLAEGCVTGAPESPVPASSKERSEIGALPSGFLGDYSDLQPHPGREDLLLFVKRGGVLADDRRFIVHQPLVYFHPESQGQGVDPRASRRGSR